VTRATAAAIASMLLLTGCGSTADTTTTSTAPVATSTTTTAVTTTTTTTTTQPTTTTTKDPFEYEKSWIGLGMKAGLIELDPFTEVIVGGEVRRVYQREVELFGEETDAWMVSVYFGRHSVTDEEIVAEFLIGRVGGDEVLTKYVVDGGFAGFSTSGGPTSAFIIPDEAAVLLKPGHRYGFRLWLDVDLSDVPADCNARCALTIEAAKYLPYNAKVVDALNEMPIDLGQDEFGLDLFFYFPPGTP